MSLFIALRGDSEMIPVIFANAFKSENYCCRNSWKCDNYMGSNTEKNPLTNLPKLYKSWSKEVKSDNFGSAIIKWGAIERYPKITKTKKKCFFDNLSSYELIGITCMKTPEFREHKRIPNWLFLLLAYVWLSPYVN